MKPRLRMPWHLAAYDGGQSLLELAVALPLFLLLLFGAIDVGLFAYGAIEVGNAARAGVAYGAQGALTAGDAPGIIAAAQADARQVGALSIIPSTYCACDSSKSTPIACPTTATNPCGQTDHIDYFVQVVAAGRFTPLVQLPGLPNPLAVSRTAVQQYSQ